MITKRSLQQLFTDTESYRVERTRSITDTDKFCQAICAFSNDLAGSEKKGYLILGVDDDGKLSGLKVDDRLLKQISNIRTDGNILPQPVMTVEKFNFKEGDVLVAEVQPSKFPPVRYRGRVWVRVGPRKSMATEAEEKILTERRLSNAHTFDAMPCLGTIVADLDVMLIKREFLPKAVAEDVLVEDKRSIEEQLASLGFYDLRYNCPTNGAIILFGNNPELYLPGSYIQYVHFKGRDRAGDIINEYKFSGNLCKELAKIDTFVETSISQKRPIPISVLREETVSKYPYWATRELLMNAIMHRDYETNAPVQFYEYYDRIEIQNPGGLYGKVSPDNFPSVSDYRNPFVAEAMKVLGYVNRFSRGIYRVQKELIENGNGEAVFDLSLITAFRVTEKISTRYFELGFYTNTLREPAGEYNVQEIFEKHPRNIQEIFEKRPRNIQETSKKHPRNIQETSKKYPRNVQETSIKQSKNILKTSKKYPRNVQETSKKHPRNVQEISEKRPRNVQETSKKYPENVQEKILQIIKDNSLITRKELEKLLNTSHGVIKYQIAQLVQKRIIRHEGATKSGKWVICT